MGFGPGGHQVLLVLLLVLAAGTGPTLSRSDFASLRIAITVTVLGPRKQERLQKKS
jgi:hypothetical protein